MESFEWEGKPEDEKTVYGTMTKKKHKYLLEGIKIVVYIHWHKLFGLLPSSTNELIKVIIFKEHLMSQEKYWKTPSHWKQFSWHLINYMVYKVF